MSSFLRFLPSRRQRPFHNFGTDLDLRRVEGSCCLPGELLHVDSTVSGCAYSALKTHFLQYDLQHLSVDVCVQDSSVHINSNCDVVAVMTSVSVVRTANQHHFQ